MKRPLILLAILVVLMGVWLVTSNKEENKMEALSAERTFHISNVKDVHEVRMSYKDKEDVRIVKEEGRWYANDSLEVWGPTMQTLLGTLRDMRIEYTAPKAAKEKIQSDIAKFGVEVVALDDSGQELMAFTLGGVTPGENGTYAIKKGYDQAFVVGIPYQEGTIRNRFYINEEEWKNRWIFREHLKDIEKVTVDYPFFPSRSFVMERLGEDEYRIGRLEGESDVTDLQQVPVGTAEGYLMQFKEIGIEAYENAYKKKDSIRSLQPLVTLTVATRDTQKWIKLYPINHETGEVDLSEEFLAKGQLFRFFGDYSSGDFVLIQFFTIGDALKKYADFVD